LSEEVFSVLIDVIFFLISSLLAVQGLGGGGIAALAAIILSDLVSLQERGAFNGLMGLYASPESQG
jgi:MFS family permease